MGVLRFCGLRFQLQQLLIYRRQINLLIGCCSADVTRDVQTEVVCFNHVQRDAFRIAILFLAELIGVDDFGEVVFCASVLAFAFNNVLDGIDEQNVVGLLAFLQHEDAYGISLE